MNVDGDAHDHALRGLARALGGRLAPCQHDDPERWFSTDTAAAVAACGTCPGRGPCGELAVALRAGHGVWAGESLAGRGARNRLRQAQRAAEPP